MNSTTTTCVINTCESPRQAKGFCRAHYNRWYYHGDTRDDVPIKSFKKNLTLEESFLAKVDKAGPLPAYAPSLGACWIWRGALTNGYGEIMYKGRCQRAHRVAYALFNGVIPDGLCLDHLCRVTECVNPRHLEPVTHRINILRGQGGSARNARKTHCTQGHPYNESNTYIYRTHRQCRTCRAVRNAQRKYTGRHS